MIGTITAPVLSVHQPWGGAIPYAGKDYENRGYACHYKGLVFIHATKSVECINDGNEFDPIGSANVGGLIRLGMRRYGLDYSLPRGVIVGVAYMDGCTRGSRSPWFFGPYGWRLRDARPCVPFPWKGSQGFRYNIKHTMEVEFLQGIKAE